MVSTAHELVTGRCNYFAKLVSTVEPFLLVGGFRSRLSSIKPPRTDVIDALDRGVCEKEGVDRSSASDEEPVEEPPVLLHVEHLGPPFPTRHRKWRRNDRGRLERCS